jgi:hypothetical protein
VRDKTDRTPTGIACASAAWACAAAIRAAAPTRGEK